MKKTTLLATMVWANLALIAQNEAPKVIPAIRQWQGEKDTLYFQGSFQIQTKGKGLKELTETLEKDLKATTPANETAKKTRITLKLDPKDAQFGNESYKMQITPQNISLSAPTTQGLFWGTRTLLQMIDTGKGKIPCGNIVDYPAYSHRGFMLDVARKFFTIDYLRDYIKILSYYKMNEFQIHLNDNGFPEYFDNDWDKTYSAFRLESDQFPGLTAKDGHYTKEEFRELQRLGQKYGVNVIPEIDIPAHSLAFAHYKPELGSDKYGKDHLDLYNPETYLFCDALLKEYTAGENPVFIGPDLHIGTDEYDKRESEKYREFTDRYLKYVESLGKNARMWGGLRWLKGETPVKADNVVVNAWSYDWVDPSKSLEDGYKLISTCDTWLYIVPSAGYYRDFLDTKWLYENWKPEKINSKETLPDGTPGLLGGMFAVWNDHCGNGVSQHDVHIRTMPAVKVLAQKMWKGSESKTDYTAYAETAGILQEGPGLNRRAVYDAKALATLPTLKQPVSMNGKTVIETAVPELGYGYSVSFDIKPETAQRKNAVLFGGPESKLLLNCDDSGCLGFTRDGYYIRFSYAPPVGKWSNIKIEGDEKGTSLFVNGELQERLEGKRRKSSLNKHGRYSYMYLLETLVFPLQQIGASENGFVGEIKNLKATQNPVVIK
ncbi:MAG: family 20 glycosylhydrolase [Bacteroidales bacterium]